MFSPIPAFQSTRPVRGATGPAGAYGNIADISIHAPRAGRDEFRVICLCDDHEFQSTRPVRGATMLDGEQVAQDKFQSTRPVRGATRIIWVSPPDPVFQSTRPVRGATAPLVVLQRHDGISIHAPRAGRDGNAESIRR